MRQLIVGDIQGCYAELRDLLAERLAGLSGEDEIIALGDIVDRGPESPRVLDFFRSQPAERARSLMGNHERKHVRSFAGELAPALSQIITRAQLGDADGGEIECMRGLPHWLELPTATLVHGFFEPGVPVTMQRPQVIIGTLSGEAYLREQYSQPWYTLYDGDRPLIVGHHDYTRTGEPFVYRERVFCIDTGCCTGGRLTGLPLPEFRILSVPSRANDWDQIKAQFRRTHPRSPAALWGKVKSSRLVRRSPPPPHLLACRRVPGGTASPRRATRCPPARTARQTAWPDNPPSRPGPPACP